MYQRVDVAPSAFIGAEGVNHGAAARAPHCVERRVSAVLVVERLRHPLVSLHDACVGFSVGTDGACDSIPECRECCKPRLLTQTVRRPRRNNAPHRSDRREREEARREGKSINQLILDRLWRAFGLSGDAPKRRDLSDVTGSWVEDADVDEALEAQRTIDDDMWR